MGQVVRAPLQQAHVASHIPGRLRLKLSPEHRLPRVMRSIKERLEAQDGVDNVRINHTTGSVTVNYSPEKHSMKGMFSLLQDLDVVISAVAGSAPVEEPSAKAPPLTFVGAVEDLNERLTSVSGVRVDLKKLLPAACAGLGVWSIAMGGLRLDKIPGMFFLWLGFDMFVKLHPPGAHA